jgi:hypothetical protein
MYVEKNTIGGSIIITALVHKKPVGATAMAASELGPELF